MRPALGGLKNHLVHRSVSLTQFELQIISISSLRYKSHSKHTGAGRAGVPVAPAGWCDGRCPEEDTGPGPEWAELRAGPGFSAAAAVAGLSSSAVYGTGRIHCHGLLSVNYHRAINSTETRPSPRVSPTDVNSFAHFGTGTFLFRFWLLEQSCAVPI